MTEPTQVVAGDTLTWTESLADYPAGTWTLNYRLVKEGKTISAQATASGTDHVVTIAASTTAGWTPGTYVWSKFVTSGALRYTIGTGSIDVKPNPAGATYDPRTVAKVMLDNVEAYLIDPNNIAAASYSIGGRSLSRWSRAELLVERDKLKLEVQQEVAKERMAAGFANPRRLKVRFDRA